MKRVALVLLALAACKGSDSTKVSAKEGSAAPGAAPTEPVKPPDILCDKAIPPSIVDTYFKGTTPKYSEPYFEKLNSSTQTSCRFVYDEASNKKILITYRCGADFANLDSYIEALQGQIRATFERVPGIGRGAYKIGTSTVGAQHRSLPCVIDVDLTFFDDGSPERTKDWMPLVQQLEAALPAASP